ncbi:hypothetical protein SAMN06265355_101365 [Actinomadura mexicana]|uniref:Uncharacterized protein n=1 Tax=Actinomadura mexicana TaxID=134959 RepID=A0A238USH0_9ACTN|nr:hypothetical protein SAMN06265355_101365 [Actinomadura mexicana]
MTPRGVDQVDEGLRVLEAVPRPLDERLSEVVVARSKAIVTTATDNAGPNPRRQTTGDRNRWSAAISCGLSQMSETRPWICRSQPRSGACDTGP